MEAPKYQQPPLDPAFGLLMQQSQQQNIEAMQTRERDDAASLQARYGRLTAGGNSGSSGGGIVQPADFGDPAAILNRYAGNMAAAGTGNSIFRKVV